MIKSAKPYLQGDRGKVLRRRGGDDAPDAPVACMLELQLTYHEK